MATMPAPAYPSSRSLLSGKTVVVTAAAGTGIGFATAKRSIEEGARVLVSDAHERRLARTAEALSALAREPVLGVVCDVTREADVQQLIGRASEQLGSIDVLVNNAGLGGTANLIDMTEEQWLRVLDVSLTGTMRVTRAALTPMLARGRGVVVNNASVLGWRAQAGQAHYAAAKAGVMAFTRCVAQEVAHAGIRINAVAPSLAAHPFLAKVHTQSQRLEPILVRGHPSRGCWQVQRESPPFQLSPNARAF
jgi:3-oxoacyl-[acyl-carrier protein] reductase